MIFVQFLVLLLLNICHGNLEEPTKNCIGCKDVNYLTYFPEELEGVWYYYAFYDEFDSVAQTDKDCLQVKFDKINCTAFNVKYCAKTELNQIKCSPEYVSICLKSQAKWPR